MNEPKCILCGGEASTLIQRGVRYDADSNVHRCSGCGLVFLSPIPSEHELSQYYSDAYRAEYLGAVLPEESYSRQVEPSRKIVRRMMPHLRPDMRLLEIGSSAGHFLEAVRPYVAKAVGVEPGLKHANWARERLGLKMVNQLCELEPGTFDAIALLHTLEHFRNPVQYLVELKTYLARGGSIFVEVPNVDDALLSLYKVPGFAEFYFQKAHLYYFSAETLRRTLAVAGLQAAVSGVQRYDLSNHFRWMLTGKPGGQSYYQSIFSESVSLAYAEALIRANCADTLWAISDEM